MLPQDALGIVVGLVNDGHSALHPWVNLLSQELIDLCHRHGLKVNTWTCDDPVRMAELLDWGIDGLCTNQPDIALEVIGQR